MERCNQCVLPDTYPGIKFDDNHICQYCKEHREYAPIGEQKLEEILKRYVTKKGKYDCIVALSGGRDSSFAAWYAVTKLGLNPLAITVDNGFIPDQIKINIKRIVDILGIDHQFIHHDYMEKIEKHILLSWLKHPDPATISLLCTGCYSGYKDSIQKVAEEHNIKLIVTGAGEPENSFAEQLLQIPGIKNKRLSLLLGFGRSIFRNPWFVLNPRVVYSIYREFKNRFAGKFRQVHFLHLFTFIHWDESLILNVINNELNWERPNESKASWRADCHIHLVKQFFYLKTLGFTKNDELVSQMIRRNDLSRDEGIERLNKDNNITPDMLIGAFSKVNLDIKLLNRFL